MSALIGGQTDDGLTDNGQTDHGKGMPSGVPFFMARLFPWCGGRGQGWFNGWQNTPAPAAAGIIAPQRPSPQSGCAARRIAWSAIGAHHGAQLVCLLVAGHVGRICGQGALARQWLASGQNATGQMQDPPDGGRKPAQERRQNLDSRSTTVAPCATKAAGGLTVSGKRPD